MIEQTLDKLFAAIQISQGLPAVESKVAALLTTLNEGRRTSQDLASQVVEDFALTQKVLKLANSPMYAPFAENTASVSSALQIVGADALLHVVLGTKMVDVAQLDEDPVLAKTLLASEVARNAFPDRLEEAAVAALMYNLGDLVANKYLPEEVAHINTLVAGGSDADMAARKVLGATVSELGAEVAKRWQLPHEIISIIDGSGDQDLVGIAKFSTTVSALLHDGKVKEAGALVATTDLPGTDKSRLEGLIRDKAEASGAKPLKMAETSSNVVLDDLHQRLSDERKRTIEELAGAIFPTFCNTLGATRCLLFMTIKSGDFCIRYGFGKGIDELKSKLKISGEFKPTAFHAAIKNNVDVSITDVAKLNASALPEGYRQWLPHVTKLLILPIANVHVSGLLYCDWESDKELRQDELEAVKNLRDLFLPFYPQ
jgi:HD-like signal output (HDOD) protein